MVLATYQIATHTQVFFTVHFLFYGKVAIFYQLEKESYGVK